MLPAAQVWVPRDEIVYTILQPKQDRGSARLYQGKVDVSLPTDFTSDYVHLGILRIQHF